MKEIELKVKRIEIANRLNQLHKDMGSTFRHSFEDINEEYVDYYSLDIKAQFQYPTINLGEDIGITINGEFVNV